MLAADGFMGTKRYFAPGFDLAKLSPAYATDGTMIAVAPNDAPAKHAATHAPGGSDPITQQPPLTHANTHAAGGTDSITALGTVTTRALKSVVSAVAFSSSITLSCDTANDFTIGSLTGNTTITWQAHNNGCQGSLSVRQDTTGGRTITFTAPAGWGLYRDSALSDLQPSAAPQSFTVYTWAFLSIAGIPVLLMTKVVPTLQA